MELHLLERCRELMAGGLPLETALELVAAGTVFTTHAGRAVSCAGAIARDGRIVPVVAL